VSGITSRLVSFACETEASEIPADVVERSKEMMLNVVAAGFAGLHESEAREITSLVRDLGGTAECTVLGSDLRTSPLNAAIANGTIVHVLDFDENVERRANHPSNVMFPAVFALGESLGASGRDVVAAFAVGCELSTKTGAAGELDEQFPSMAKYGWHIQGVTGALGAAAAAGRLLELDRVRMEHAVGIAVSHASGVQVNFGTSAKPLQAGTCAANGILCALAAQRGFTAAGNAVEDANGLFGAYRRSTDVDAEQFGAALGGPWDVIDPGVRLKLYPCGSLTHVSLEAMLQLVDEHGITPDEVAAISISLPLRWGSEERIYGVEAKTATHPETGLQARFSLNYCVALALVHGRPQLQHFTDEAVADPVVRSLLDKITVDGDETPEGDANRPSTVRLTLRDGKELSARVLYPKGHAKNPVSSRELDDKLRACSRGVLSAERADEVIEAFRTLDDAPDVRAVARLLSA
jgi:2-methylcitrate dehydratase PrpD